jgi:uncharacterized protein (DUF2062 family)
MTPTPDVDIPPAQGAAPRRRAWHPRSWLAAICTQGLSAHQVARAWAIGALFALAPIPGLQLPLSLAVAWRLRLNIPMVLLASNLSFGPLLGMWAAFCACVGIWVRGGGLPWQAYPGIAHTIAQMRFSWSGSWLLVKLLFVNWLVGWLIVGPVIAAGCAGLAYLVWRPVASAVTSPEGASA